MIDLVEPENGYAALGVKDVYKETFMYGNVLISRGATINGPNMVHWNEDHQMAVGRAVRPGSRLFFYHNTVLVVANQADFNSFHVFNTTWGGYDCPGAATAGVIDVRNNIFAAAPRTPGAMMPLMRFAHCRDTNFAFGPNWVSPGWVVGTSGSLSGATSFVSPANNSPGFVGANDLHLTQSSSAAGIGGALAPEVLDNSLGMALVPSDQYVEHQQITRRVTSGAGSDAGAFELRRHRRQFNVAGAGADRPAPVASPQSFAVTPRGKPARLACRLEKVGQPVGHVLPPTGAAGGCSVPLRRSLQAGGDSGCELLAIPRGYELVDAMIRQLGYGSHCGCDKRGSTRLRFEQGVRHPLPVARKDGHVRSPVIVREPPMRHSARKEDVLSESLFDNLRFKASPQRPIADEIKTKLGQRRHQLGDRVEQHVERLHGH
jgi:hypothetical protein